MFLTIRNSDGDVYHTVTLSRPDVEEYEDVEGLMFLDAEPDSNYWPEGTVVVLEVKDVLY